MKKIRIVLLHLLPVAGDIRYNRNLIEKAVQLAAAKHVDWIITPELVVSGLQFSKKIGTDWIKQQPDEWMTRFFALVKSLNTNVFLGCPESSANGELYNSVFVISRNGELIGRQRKISSITDDWSHSGTIIEPIDLENIKVGIVICADAYTKNVADTLLTKGAEMIIAPSAWGPGLHEPSGEWEQRSIETGLPFIVCNRTGEDETVTFWGAKSLVIENGKHLLSHQSVKSAILTFEWDAEKMELISPDFEIDYLPEE
ncbi:carbon-nitrogen hydrolase family protein [Bacillus aerolatus]|uniref:Carbon-nitrogen hydrolase family protein n=1 Tax=Bacillus aerolatus TaxID=2653354 RepID=A0A6I1FKJ3_9BACI|nr:carbon-nitrogen hydrolase family protein [Bacillus aerolatus]KAB7707182.1 carbon-nitrogen hydrolase family protein [Bacillus aerolatus]